MRTSTTTIAWRRAWLTAITIGILAASGVQAQERPDATALPAFLFHVEIGGVDLGFFKSVTGLGVENEVLEFRDADVIHKVPGVKKYPNIVLKRGFTGSSGFFNWVSSFKNGSARVDGAIIMLSTGLTEVARWQFHNGFPAKWQGPELDASKNEIAIETLEIAHEGLTMVKR